VRRLPSRKAKEAAMDSIAQSRPITPTLWQYVTKLPDHEKTQIQDNDILRNISAHHTLVMRDGKIFIGYDTDMTQQFKYAWINPSDTSGILDNASKNVIVAMCGETASDANTTFDHQRKEKNPQLMLSMVAVCKANTLVPGTGLVPINLHVDIFRNGWKYLQGRKKKPQMEWIRVSTIKHDADAKDAYLAYIFTVDWEKTDSNGNRKIVIHHITSPFGGDPPLVRTKPSAKDPGIVTMMTPDGTKAMKYDIHEVMMNKWHGRKAQSQGKK